jgi:hypothetical protein
MKFKKDYFEKHKPVTNKEVDLDEFFNLDDSNLNIPNDSQIQSGPYNKTYDDKSDYEKGISLTTDKKARYSNPRNWWQLYLRGYPLIRTNESVENVDETKEKLKEIIIGILNKRSDLDGLIKNMNNNSDLVQTSNLQDKSLKDLIDNCSPEELQQINDYINLKLNNNA